MHVFVVAIFWQVVEMYILQISKLIFHSCIMCPTVKMSFFSFLLLKPAQSRIALYSKHRESYERTLFIMSVCSLISEMQIFLFDAESCSWVILSTFRLQVRYYKNI